MNMLVLLVILPLLGAFLIPSIGRFSGLLAKIIGPAILIYLLGLSSSAWKAISLAHPINISFAGFDAPFGIIFYIDQLSLLFSILIALMFIIAWPWQKALTSNATENREYSLYLLLIASSFGLVLSGDLFNLYVFYELLAVASYGLIAHSSETDSNNKFNLNKGARAAASLRYLYLSSAGSVVLLLGIGVIYTQTGTLNIAQLAILAPEKLNNFAGLSAFIFILIGVGVKAEMFPVNSWVPEVYGVISKPLAVLMAGLISKLAVLFIIRILLMVFQQAEVLQVLLIVGVLGVISGEFIAWRARDMVRMLSFSSIAQLGLIFIAFSIPGSTGLFIGLALMLHHLIVKSGLFFLSDKLDGSFENLKGSIKRSPFAVILFILFILSLLGIPPLPGFWVKLSLVMNLSLIENGYYAIGFILLATVVEASYLFRLVRQMFQTDNVADTGNKKENTLFYLYAQAFALILVLSLLFISPIEKKINQIAHQSSNTRSYIQTVFPNHFKSPIIHQQKQLKAHAQGVVQ